MDKLSGQLHQMASQLEGEQTFFGRQEAFAGVAMPVLYAHHPGCRWRSRRVERGKQEGHDAMMMIRGAEVV